MKHNLREWDRRHRRYWLAGLTSRAAASFRPGLASSLAVSALVVFVLDVLVRGVFDLGWQPFV